MAECSRHPGLRLLPGCWYCHNGAEAERLPEEAMTIGELGHEVVAFLVMLVPEAKVMLRVNGQVLDCTRSSLVCHEGRYVLMLDGEARE